MDSRVIGSSTSWTWSMPSRAIGAEYLGDVCRVAGQRLDPRLAGYALDPADAARQADEDGHGALDCGRVATDLAAGFVDERAERPARRRAGSRCP